MEYASKPFLELRGLAAELDYTIEFTHLRSATECMNGRVDYLYLPSEYDNMLINTFGRQCTDILLADWDLEQQSRWRKIDAANAGICLYQAGFGERRYVRVIRATEQHVSMMSSTAVRRLCSQMADKDLDRCEIVPDMVLSWDMLKSDANSGQWRACKLFERADLESSASEEGSVDEILKAWDAEKMALGKLINAREARP